MIPSFRQILLLFIYVASVVLTYNASPPDNDTLNYRSAHWVPKSALRQAAARRQPEGLLYTGNTANTPTRWMLPLGTAASAGAIVLTGVSVLALTKFHQRKRTEASGHLRTGLSGPAGHISFPEQNGDDEESFQSDDDDDGSTDYRHMALRSSDNYWPSFTSPNTPIASNC